MAGLFDLSAQLADSIIGDPRVTATLNSRITGLFGREARHRPANESRAAKEVLDAWVEAWPRLCAGGSFQQCHAYQILMGFMPAQLLWDSTTDILRPILSPWHPRFTYYNWDIRKYIAISRDGGIPILAGNAKWVLHAPRGEYRGWLWGAIRPIAEPFILRHFATRDMARYSEVHGMPIKKAWVPAASAQPERDRYMQQVSRLDREGAVMLTRGVSENDSYDLELLEAVATAWEIFPGLVDRCDMDITLALMSENLTTEVKGGSFAATSVHEGIRQDGIETDNEGWKFTIHDQIARAFAYLNFGDADLAPWSDWDVTPREDFQKNGATFVAFGQAVQILRQGGVQFPDATQLRSFARDTFGLKLPETTTITEPDSGSGGTKEAPKAKPKEDAK